MTIASLVRTSVERFTGRWVLVRRLPVDFSKAPIYVTPSARLRYLLTPMSEVDPALLRNAQDLVRPNDVVWDIGANVGLFSFAAASRAGSNGTVVAFEPDNFLVELLRRSAKIQPISSAPVSIIPAALAADVSLRSFTIVSRSRASNAIDHYGHFQMVRADGKQTVVALTLDWCAERLPPPNVIKCDVEGAEVEVFSKQDNILQTIRPVIICEVAGGNYEKITQILLRARYRLFHGDKPLSLHTQLDEAYWSTIAIPEEKVEDYLSNRPRRPESRGPDESPS